MELIINTTYNIGDELYLITNYSDKPVKILVKEISLTDNKYNLTYIYKVITDTNQTLYVDEKDLFKTFNEAKDFLVNKNLSEFFANCYEFKMNHHLFNLNNIPDCLKPAVEKFNEFLNLTEKMFYEGDKVSRQYYFNCNFTERNHK